jgi:Family of unknown function (DUF6508)
MAEEVSVAFGRCSYLPMRKHDGRVEEGDVMPTKCQIDALLPYLDRFTAEGFSVGTWHSPPEQIPWFEFSEPVSEFLQALYDGDWITPFDWGAWQETAREFVEHPRNVESADAETIQKLFTTHVRKERLCEGHLAAMFENGHIVALLRRLKAIRETVTAEPPNVAKQKRRGE